MLNGAKMQTRERVWELRGGYKTDSRVWQDNVERILEKEDEEEE